MCNFYEDLHKSKEIENENIDVYKNVLVIIRKYCISI